MPQQKRPAVSHRPFPHKRDTLERILQPNAHAIGILIHFIDDLLSPRSLIQVEAHIRGLDGEFQIFINLVAGVRVQFPRVVGRGEIGERAVYLHPVHLLQVLRKLQLQRTHHPQNNDP